MSIPVRAGLIGCGALSLKGILPQLALPDARARLELVAVCDKVPARAQAVAEQFDVPDAYDDAQRIFERDDIDLVLVITPIAYHFPYGLAALEANKHVYVQKTMTATYAEAQQLVKTARQRHLSLVAAPGQMLAPAFRLMRTLVADGALGPVYWAWGSTPGWDHEIESFRQGDDVLNTVDPSWYYTRSGGPLRDVTVYVLHSLTGILGPARRVTAMSGTRRPERRWRDRLIPVEIDDNSLLLLDFGDATFAVAGGHSSAGGPAMQWGAMGIYGAAGAIETVEVEPLSGHPATLHISTRQALPGLEIDASGLVTLPGRLPYVDDAHAAIPEPHVYADIMHAVDCIRDGTPPVASGEHAAHVIEIIEKGLLAARTGQTQNLESTFMLPREEQA